MTPRKREKHSTRAGSKVRRGQHDVRQRHMHVPKLASGFSSLMRSLQSWTKNMYADSARLGPLLPFFAFAARGARSAFSAALRWEEAGHASASGRYGQGAAECGPWACH